MRSDQFGLRTSELRDGVRDGVWCRTEVHEVILLFGPFRSVELVLENGFEK